MLTYLLKEWKKVIHHFKANRKRDVSPEEGTVLTVSEQSQDKGYSKQLERTKINGAVRTDFILSAEIIIIAMEVVANMDILPKALVMIAIGLCITVFVYDFVALIVKLDDMGLWFMQKESKLLQKLGRVMIVFMPHLMRGLAIIGTIAMFLVGGGIFTHSWSWLQGVAASIATDSFFLGMLIDLVVGMLVGLVVYLLIMPFINLQRAETSRLALDD